MGFTKQTLATLVSLALITACGGGSAPIGGGGSAPIGGGTTDGGTDSGTSGASATYTLALSLKACDDVATLSTCKEQSTLPADKPNLVEATLLNEKSQPVQGAVVDANTSEFNVGTIQAPSKVLTDAQGKARFTLVADATNGGAVGKVTTTASYKKSDGTDDTLSQSKTFDFGAINLTMSLETDAATLALNSTTVVRAKLYNNGAPYLSPISVTFTSPCATNNAATLSTPVISNNGVAEATYKGSKESTADGSTTSKVCGLDDIITASASGLVKTVTISNLTTPASAIEAVTTDPNFIFTPGSGFKDNATITFQVKDKFSNPKAGQKVMFKLEGIDNQSDEFDKYSLSQSEGTTDSEGKVAVNVKSGSIPTPFSVSAYLADNTEIRTVSGKVGVGMGFPDDDSFTIGLGSYNIEGESYNDAETNITVRLGDRFNNSVPDGTKVFFTSEGGTIQGNVPSGQGLSGVCETKDGACSAKIISTQPRPADGRVTILAYVQGEESFFDVNGNKIFDQGDLKNITADQKAADTPKDANGIPQFLADSRITDIGEPYLEYELKDEDNFPANGVWKADKNDNHFISGVDEFKDLDGSKDYTPGDSVYTGPLCSQDLVDRGFCKRSLTTLFQKKLEVIFTSFTGYRVQYWSAGGWADVTGALDVRSGVAIRYMPLNKVEVDVPGEIPGTTTKQVIAWNPIPSGTKMSASADNGGKLRGGCLDDTKGNAYDSPYPSTTRPVWYCLTIDPEDPIKPSNGALEIKGTTPKGHTQSVVIPLTDMVD